MYYYYPGRRLADRNRRGSRLPGPLVLFAGDRCRTWERYGVGQSASPAKLGLSCLYTQIGTNTQKSTTPLDVRPSVSSHTVFLDPRFTVCCAAGLSLAGEHCLWPHISPAALQYATTVSVGIATVTTHRLGYKIIIFCEREASTMTCTLFPYILRVSAPVSPWIDPSPYISPLRPETDEPHIQGRISPKANWIEICIGWQLSTHTPLMFMSVRYINGSVGPFLQQAGQLLHLCYKTPHLNVFARHNMMKLFRRLSEGGPGLLDIIDRSEYIHLDIHPSPLNSLGCLLK